MRKDPDFSSIESLTHLLPWQAITSRNTSNLPLKLQEKRVSGLKHLMYKVKHSL